MIPNNRRQLDLAREVDHHPGFYPIFWDFLLEKISPQTWPPQSGHFGRRSYYIRGDLAPLAGPLGMGDFAVESFSFALMRIFSLFFYFFPSVEERVDGRLFLIWLLTW